MSTVVFIPPGEEIDKKTSLFNPFPGWGEGGKNEQFPPFQSCVPRGGKIDKKRSFFSPVPRWEEVHFPVLFPDGKRRKKGKKPKNSVFPRAVGAGKNGAGEHIGVSGKNAGNLRSIFAGVNRQV